MNTYTTHQAVARRLDGRVVLVPISGTVARASKLFETNETGLEVWTWMSGRKSFTVEDIADFSRTIDDRVSASELVRDALDFLHECVRQGLVEVDV